MKISQHGVPCFVAIHGRPALSETETERGMDWGGVRTERGKEERLGGETADEL